jgi:methyl acetate hydrolase
MRAEVGPVHGMKAIPNIISCQSVALSLPLAFNPGEKWDYGINIDWVGKAVERAVRCSVTVWRSICLSRLA